MIAFLPLDLLWVFLCTQIVMEEEEKAKHYLHPTSLYGGLTYTEIN
jgi:hypothetical protein